MRWKHGDEQRGLESGCCWCCHIRTGAIIMGILHLIWYILSLVVAGFIIMLLKQLSQMRSQGAEVLNINSMDIDNTTNETEENDGVSFYLNTFKFNKMENSYTWDDDDQYFIIAVLGGCIVCSVLLIYGAAKGEGSYLMPFFILKVFSFSLGCLYMVSFCGGTWANAQFRIDDENQMVLNYPFLLMSAVFIIGVWLEAYFAYVAWACYRYLRLTADVGVMGRSMYEDESEMLLPPKYEDIILIPVEEDPQPTPPPAYISEEDSGTDEQTTTRAVVN